PFWRRFLPEPHAAVMVWRAPLAVARSLEKRDGTPLPDGIALWERYNRAALDALEGSPVYVTSYDELLGDPTQLSHALGTWLDTLEWLEPWRGTWDPGRAAAVVTETLRHQRPGPDDPPLGSQDELVERLRQLGGAHRSLPAAGLAPPSPWGTALVDEHRKLVLVNRQIDTLREDHRAALEASRRAHEAERALMTFRSTTSWQITRPLRSISARLLSRKDGP
ncbi:MAG TPA: hypothetical protein VF320_07640, partial [Acidimicrobiales bacterium]